MDTQTIIKNLHPLEIRVLRSYKPAVELTSEKLQKELSYKEGHANQAFSWLSGKELAVIVRKEPHTFYEITELGKTFAEQGTVEQRIIHFLKTSGPAFLPQIAQALSVDNKDVGSAFGTLSKEGILTMDAEKKAAYTGKETTKRISIIDSLLKKALTAPEGLLNQADLQAEEIEAISTLAKKRGAADSAFRIVERETVVYTLTKEALEIEKALEQAGITGDEIGSLTPKMLAAGEWKKGVIQRIQYQCASCAYYSRKDESLCFFPRKC